MARRPGIAAWALLALVVLIDAVVRLRLLDVPLDRDEGEYAYFGQLLLQGIPPYTTAYNFKLPGIYGVYAGILATFGQTPAGVHLGLLVANVAGCVLTFLLAIRLFTPVAGIAAGAAFTALSLSSKLYGLTAYAEHFVLLPALAGALALLSAVGSRRPLVFLASGVLFGLAFIVKQNGAAFVLFGALYALVQRADLGDGRSLARRLAPTLALLGGALLPYAVLCVALARVGAFERFWSWTTVYAYHYASQVPPAQGLRLLAFTSGEILEGTYLVIALAAVGAAALVWDREARSQRWFVGLLVLCSFAGTAAGLHFRRQYFLLLVPCAALLAGLAVDAVTRGLRASAPALRIGVPLALALLLVAQLLYAERDVLLEPVPERVARALWGLNPFPESIEVARYITARAAEGDRIAVIGSEPQIYFYTHRPAATGFIYTYPLMDAQPYAPQMQRQMIAEIEAAKPRFVVLVNASASWIVQPGSDRTLFQWWERYRQSLDCVGFVDITDRGTTYVWDAAAPQYKPTSLVWLAIFERRPGAR
jgi:4-amino-4-deoxy-L-arabinose transferase-like glycosyltransferase